MADVQSPAVIANNYPSSNVPRGMVLASVGSYTIPATDGPGIGDKVEMVRVPKGAIILDVVVSCPVAGTATMTIDVGDDALVDRFVDGIVASAAFVSSLSADGDDANSGVGYEYTTDDTIDMTFLTAAPTATHVYTMVVTYVMAQG